MQGAQPQEGPLRNTATGPPEACPKGAPEQPVCFVAPA